MDRRPDLRLNVTDAWAAALAASAFPRIPR